MKIGSGVGGAFTEFESNYYRIEINLRRHV